MESNEDKQLGSDVEYEILVVVDKTVDVVGSLRVCWRVQVSYDIWNVQELQDTKSLKDVVGSCEDGVSAVSEQTNDLESHCVRQPGMQLVDICLAVIPGRQANHQDADQEEEDAWNEQSSVEIELLEVGG